MNIVIVHGYAHRILNNNTIESAPVYESSQTVRISPSEWQARSEEEMDLSGGDVELIRQTLQTLSFVFVGEGQRLPEKAEQTKTLVEPLSPK